MNTPNKYLPDFRDESLFDLILSIEHEQYRNSFELLMDVSTWKIMVYDITHGNPKEAIPHFATISLMAFECIAGPLKGNERWQEIGKRLKL